MTLEPVCLRLDRIAGGRSAGITIPEEARAHALTRRGFVLVARLLAAELLIGSVAVVVAVVLQLNGVEIPFAVWLRSLAVLAITVTLAYFAWRASRGFYWAYSRLRLFSTVFPVVTLVVAAVPNLYPLWMVAEQVVFSLVLVGVAEILGTEHIRTAFPKPAGRAKAAPGTAMGSPA